jgi:hypothetical protein
MAVGDPTVNVAPVPLNVTPVARSASFPECVRSFSAFPEGAEAEGLRPRPAHLSAAATEVESAGGACEANVSAIVAQAVPAAEIH